MTSHELARQLLENPDLPVVVPRPGMGVELRPSHPIYGITEEYITEDAGIEKGKIVRLG